MTPARPTYDELTDRITALEAMLHDGALPLDAFPMRALSDRLTELMVPESDNYLLPHSAGTDSLAAVPAARVYNNAIVGAYLANNAYTPMRFDTIEFQQGVQINLTTFNTRVTIVTPGIYLAYGGGTIDALGGNEISIAVARNGDIYSGAAATTYGTASATAGVVIPTPQNVRLVKMVPGDYFETTLFQNSGAPATPHTADSVKAHLAVQYVSYVEGL